MCVREKGCVGLTSVCAILPGSFGEAEGQYVEWLREYCQAFFYGLVVKLLPSVTVAATGCAFRVNSSTQNLLIHSGKQVGAFLTASMSG